MYRRNVFRRKEKEGDGHGNFSFRCPCWKGNIASAGILSFSVPVVVFVVGMFFGWWGGIPYSAFVFGNQYLG